VYEKAQEEAEEAIQDRLLCSNATEGFALVASPRVWSETHNAEIAKFGARFRRISRLKRDFAGELAVSRSQEQAGMPLAILLLILVESMLEDLQGEIL
jgi:hypothetical protein